MSKDDTRQHGGNTPGMVPGRGHERFEEEVRLNHHEPGEEQPGTTGGRAGGRQGGATEDTTADVTNRHQPSALGGHTATTSGRGETPADERDG